MTTALNIIIFIAAFFLQTTFLPRFNVFGLVPNLLLIIVAAFALYGKTYESYVYAFVAGLVLDTLFGGPYGFHIAMFMAVVFAASLFSGEEDTEAPSQLGIIFTAVASLLFYGILWLVVGFGAKNFTLNGGVFSLEEAGVTTLFALIILPLARRLFQFEKRAAEVRRVQ